MPLARAARAGAALALLAALAAAQPPAPAAPPPAVEPDNLPTPAPGLAPYFNKEKFSVCVVNAPPYSSCSNESDPAGWTGYDVELFRRAMPYLGWKDSMIEWCAPRRAQTPLHFYSGPARC